MFCMQDSLGINHLVTQHFPRFSPGSVVLGFVINQKMGANKPQNHPLELA
uniref:Uncharacterized protein n=1 Tax=Anguilla anguilla TaxID=7936 RepID=A0A0E9Q2L9_ANGAN